MITDAVMDFLHGLAVALTTWINSSLPPAPVFVAQLAAGFTTAYGMVPDSLKYFLPIAPLFVAGTALVGLLLVLGVIRFARRVLSLFTGGGGNA